MTTDDIKAVQIMLETNDGKVLVGTATDNILIRMIASYVKFVMLDKSEFTSVPIKDIISTNTEKI